MRIKEKCVHHCGFSCLFAAVVGIFVYNASLHAEDAEDWMPDPILHQVVRDKLGIPDGVRMTLHDLLRLRDLITKDNRIESLEGLQNAVNLHFLSVCCSKISDLTPLAELKNLHTLKVYNNQIFRYFAARGVDRATRIAVTK